MDRAACGTTFDRDRNTRGSGERYPSCGTIADLYDGSADAGDGAEPVRIEADGGTVARITIEVVPTE